MNERVNGPVTLTEAHLLLQSIRLHTAEMKRSRKLFAIGVATLIFAFGCLAIAAAAIFTAAFGSCT